MNKIYILDELQNAGSYQYLITPDNVFCVINKLTLIYELRDFPRVKQFMGDLVTPKCKSYPFFCNICNATHYEGLTAKCGASFF